MAPPDATKKVVLGCVALAAAGVAGAVLYYKFLRREEAEEELNFTISKQSAEKPEKTESASRQKDDTPKAAAAAKAGDLNLDALADELLGVAKTAPGTVADDGGEEGYETFADIGLKCKAPEGWELASEDGPTPQIAVVKLYPKGLTEEQRMDPTAFGSHPNIMVMVEDTVEPMTAKEYKDKSKEMAIKSGQGMMQITSDDSVKVGPFEFQLEGRQPIPDPSQGRIMQIKFLNLLTMKGSCGYAVQYISTDDSFSQNLDFVMEWASTIKIFDLAPRGKSTLQYTNADHQVQINVPWSWNVVKEPKGANSERTFVAGFKTPGTTSDSVVLYKAKAPCASAAEHLEQQLAAVGATATAPPTADDAVSHCTYRADGKEVALYCTAGYALEVRPEGRAAAVPEGVLREALGSVTTAAAEKTGIRYVNNHHRFSFDMTADCSIAEFKFGTTAVMYSPVPQPEEDSEANIPIFKVFVNKEQEHYADLKAVEAKLREACDPSTPMRDCQVEKIGNAEWLTFTTSFMDGPYGPFGPREEYKSKVFICLRGDESFMLKWEIAANEWRRYERYLTQLMDSMVISA